VTVQERRCLPIFTRSQHAYGPAEAEGF